MKLPIRILVTDLVELPTGVTWGEVITNWEAYMLEWQEVYSLTSPVTELPVLDMFDDGAVTVKEVLKDSRDPSKLFTDYSRTFTLPASKKNNQIFRHYYKLEVNDGFDARSLVKCKLLMNNEVYKVGNLQLESVKMQNGKASSYTVRFYGKLSELGKKLGKDKIQELPFSTITSFNQYSNFATTATTDLVFPLCSRENRFKWSATKTAYDATPKTKTIQYIDGTRNATNYGIEPLDLIGAYKVGSIISKIETKYGFTFTGALKQDYVDKLYLWLNNFKEESGTTIYDAYVENLSPSTTSFTGLFVDATNHWFQYLGGNTYEIGFKGIWTGNGRAEIYNNGAKVAEVSTSNTFATYTVTGTPSIIEYRIFTETAQTVNTTTEVKEKPSNVLETFTGSVVVNSVDTYVTKEYVPEMSVTDFLSAIFKAFNIVAIVQDDLTINTYHYDSFMANGSIKDISNYVDTDNADVTPPNFYNSISFKHKYSNTAIEEGYLSVNGKEYGSLDYESTNISGDRIAGEGYSIETPFTVIPNEEITTDLYHTYFGDSSLNKVKTSPSFTYLIPTFSVPVAYDNGTNVVSVASYIMPSNTYDPLYNAATTSYLNGLYFGSELIASNRSTQSSGLGLYSCFYQGLIGQLLDDDKRIYKVKALFNQGFIKNLSLADVLTIRGNYYNISSIETEYNTGISNLELVQVGTIRNPLLSVRTATATNSTGSTVYITYVNSSGYLTSSSIANTGSASIDIIGTFKRDTGNLTWSYS